MPLLAFKTAAYLPAQKIGGYAQQKPVTGELRADLSHEIIRHTRVIPHVPVHNKIIEYPDYKLREGDTDRSGKAAFQKRQPIIKSIGIA